MEYVVEMLNIRKEFPGIVANDNITLQLKEGEVHALLGENGAGKSTLMGMLFGMYKPDRGCIKVRGKEVKISNPNIANDLGIGMVHQHFKLVDNFTVTENIILGCEPKKGLVVDIKTAAKRIEESGLDYTIIRPTWITDKNEVDYEKSEKGEPIKDTEVSRKSVAAYVYHLIKYPKEDIGKSIGLGKPGTEGDKPSWY